jgi:hypothetical protein
MIPFLLRKSFLHCWDNLYKLMGVNLCLALLLALYWRLASLPSGGFLGLPIIYVFNLLIGATSVVAREISDYDVPEARLFLLAVKGVWKDALFFSVCFLLNGMLLDSILPFYLTLGSRIAGLLLAVLLFWACLAWWAAMVYYYPVRLRLNLPVFAAVRQAFLLFADNLAPSLAVFLLSAAALTLSLLTAMLLPGIALVLVFHQVAGRTLLLKYRYLDGHPQAKGEIPWSLLLKDDLEVIGRRSLKGIVFPWKE